MNRDVVSEIPDEKETWVVMIASACFVEELDLDSLPLSEVDKGKVRCIIEELKLLSPLEALSRCLSDASPSSSREP